MPRETLFVLAATAIVATAAGQSCVNTCVSSHWGEPLLQNAQFLPTTMAIRVPGLPQNDTICRIELFCRTRGAQPVAMPVWIYDRGPSGAPQSPLAAGTMTVTPTPAACTATVQATVQANSDFFVVFDNAIGNLTPPVASWGGSGSTPQEHWHTGPNWAGPFFSGEYIYRLYCSSGTVEASFATVGQGCPGSYGVPVIAAVGDPVLGSVTQLTLTQAPLSAPAIFAVGDTGASTPLTTVGAPGCVLELQPVALNATTTGSIGATSFPFAIPNQLAFVGMQVHTQWAVVDPGVNQLGLVFSKGGILTIGDF